MTRLTLHLALYGDTTLLDGHPVEPEPRDCKHCVEGKVEVCAGCDWPRKGCRCEVYQWKVVECEMCQDKIK